MTDGGPRPFDRVTVVGARGAVGSLLARRLRGHARVLQGIDLRPPGDAHRFDAFFLRDARAHDGTTRDAIAASDCVVLALPAAAAMTAAVPIASLLARGALFVDTLSVKMPICAVLMAAAPRCDCLSINPMFAPALDCPGQNVLAVGASASGAAARFVAALESWGARVWSMSAEEHDRFCAVVQAATHFAILALGTVLEGPALPRPFDASPPPHRICSALLARMLTADPEVYWEIQRDNAFAHEARHTLLARAAALHEAFAAQRRDRFHSDLAAIRQALGNRIDAMAALGNVLVRAARPEAPGP